MTSVNDEMEVLRDRVSKLSVLDIIRDLELSLPISQRYKINEGINALSDRTSSSNLFIDTKISQKA